MAGEYGLFEFQDEALMPRYYIGDPRPTLHKRQDNKCDEDHHQCKSRPDGGFTLSSPAGAPSSSHASRTY